MFDASSFEYPCSPVLCFFYRYSFLLFFLLTSLQFSFSRPMVSINFHLPSSQYYIFFILSLHLSFGLPMVSINFHLPSSQYYIFFSLSFHNHLSLASLIFSPMFVTPVLDLISMSLILFLCPDLLNLLYSHHLNKDISYKSLHSLPTSYNREYLWRT